jgi:subtilisin family serine protease
MLAATGLCAGQLDARLKRLQRQWGQDRVKVLARVEAESSAKAARTTPLARMGEEVTVQTTIALSSTSLLDRLGIAYTRITPNVVTARVPLSSLEDLERDGSITHVGMAHRVQLHNDINMTKIHASVPYAEGYTGENVLVGVIDSGVDVNHPAFRVGGVASGASRIKYLWDQTADHVPFNVGSFTSSKGRRWTDSEITAGSCTETDTNGHGTHVMGSAAGYDAAFPARHGGAKSANILFVKTTFSSVDILNGLVWLNEQAKALGKPIVVNMSLGSHYGPHDGTDTDTKAIDDLVAASNGNLIVVRSAGNYAEDGVHGSVGATTTGGSMPFTVGSYTPSDSVLDCVAFNFYVDASATVSLRVKDSAGNYSDWLTPSTTAYDGTMPDGTGFHITNAAAAESYNSSIKLLYVELGEMSSRSDGKYIRPGSWALEFKTASGSARVDGWLWYLGDGDNDLPGVFAPADKDVTLGNGACGKNIVSVAAYVSRKYWDASDGKRYNYPSQTQDAIATFSSIGPTRDGRQKPDVTAGGTQILSTRSAATAPDASYLPPEGSTFYRYMQGTSMASPTVAGAVALLKEAHPAWTYADVIDYFKTHSQGTTVHTTQGTWDKNWGWGVVDLTDSVSALRVSINPSGTVQMLPGATQAFTATVTNATNNAVNWTVNGGSITPATTAGDGTATATFTAPATVGTCVVTATSVEDGTKSASTTVQVFDLGQVTVVVNPASVTLLTGGTQTFSATVSNVPSGGTLAWSVSSGGGTINASTGAYTAPATAGTYTVTATSSWGKSGTATVTVKTLDLNGDGAVDVLDVLQLTKRWAGTEAADLAVADLNGDGAIGDADLSLLLNAI